MNATIYLATVRQQKCRTNPSCNNCEDHRTIPKSLHVAPHTRGSRGAELRVSCLLCTYVGTRCLMLRNASHMCIICMPTQIHTSFYVHLYMYAYKKMNMCINNIYMYVCICTCSQCIIGLSIHLYIYICICICICTPTHPSIHPSIHTSIHPYIHAWPYPISQDTLSEGSAKGGRCCQSHAPAVRR